ncbi:ABC transporter permease|uniref:Putative ABC transport system permease protein n=1 Tax=Dendrosporobacter quercicolus TaxID=146817 RepID=A0A1G9QZ92_9FIRM|nr:FtsX-like permease family protein [Dendrosporobacter quercicolus]NSL48422.1 ABC transporter permease [Dendrosporobacter quercicolus DSM 1736]SDM16329.1 putative ABC transport system permease protein [Dendrosporobacter quercicolus]
MMKYSLYAKMILYALLRRRSRMIVALLAVAIGATVLSGLVTLYYDVPRQMGREFRSYGANLLLLPDGDSQVLQQQTAQAAAALLPQDKIVGLAPYLYERVKVNAQPVMAAGTDFAAVQKVSPYWQITGQWPAPGSGGAVIGAEVAEQLGLEPGQTVTVSVAGIDEAKSLPVAGIVHTGGSEEEFIFMELPLLQTWLDKPGQVSVAQVSVQAGEAELTAWLQQVAGTVPGIAPRLVKQLIQSEGLVLGKLQALVYLVTLIVLLLTLICVATTMMAVVTERRKEIGLKKALGAENRSIVMEFMGEGMALGGLGGLLGIGCGFFFAHTVSLQVFARPIAFHPLIALATFVVAVVVAGVACLIPVRMATNVEPAIVLRGE